MEGVSLFTAQRVSLLYKWLFESRVLLGKLMVVGVANRVQNTSLCELHSFLENWSQRENTKGPATQNAVCRSGLRSLSAAECYILSRLF